MYLSKSIYTSDCCAVLLKYFMQGFSNQCATVVADTI